MIQVFPECQEGPGLGSNKPLLYSAPQQQPRVEHTYWNLSHNELSPLGSDLRGLLPPWSQTGPSKRARQKEVNKTHCPFKDRKWALQITGISHISAERWHKEEERKLRTTYNKQFHSTEYFPAQLGRHLSLKHFHFWRNIVYNQCTWPPPLIEMLYRVWCISIWQCTS